MQKTLLPRLSVLFALFLMAACRQEAGRVAADFEPRPGETSLIRTSSAAGAGVTFLDIGLDDALAKARSKRSLVMVDVFTDWCGWCKKLDRDVFQDPRVASALKNFVSIKLDAEHGGERTAQRFAIDGFPTILFFSSDGKLVKRVDGYVDADKMLQIIATIPTNPG